MVRSRSWKWLGFRLAAVALGLLPWLLLEFLLRGAGWPSPLERADPFVGFQNVVPLFTRDEASGRYVTAAGRRGYFRPESFEIRKSAGEFRIFCLGGSTVQGNPWGIETSFTTWLQLSLEAADPEREWQVVNCGGISYASYRLLPILKEVLNYEPDLILLCTGHNEFLEQRSYAAQRDAPLWRVRFESALQNVHLYRAGQRALRELTAGRNDSQRAILPTEVEALLDYRGGLESYQRDDVWRDNVIRHFATNLEIMVQSSQAAGIPVLLVAPIANLKDCPPFKVEPSGDLSPQQRAECTQLWQQARASGDPAEQVWLLKKLLSVDARRADAHYLLGRAYARLRWPDEARHHLVRAKEEDVCPLRMLEPMYQHYARIAERYQLPLVDMRAVLEPLCELSIAGEEVLVDHVHPSIAGHQRIADQLLQKLEQLEVVRPETGWPERRRERFGQHLATLGEGYYARGQEHLAGLRRWTQGRVAKMRPGNQQRGE